MVYASLPWGYRLAKTFFELKIGSTASDFGRTAYGIFLLSDVTGMPEAPFIPKNTRDISRLPKNYGVDFGRRAEVQAMKGAKGNKTDSEDILAKAWTRLLTETHLKESLKGKTLKDAEGLVLRMVMTTGFDFAKSKSRQRIDDVEGVIEQTSGDWGDLGELLLESEKKELLKEMEKAVSPRIAPDLPLYFQLLMDGVSNKTILEEGMLPSLKDNPVSEVTMYKYRNSIKEVLEKHLEKADRESQ
jgi:hypothetical protein